MATTGRPSSQSRSRLFGSMLTLVFMINMGRIVFAPLIEPFRAAFVMTPGEAGLVATLAWLGSALPRLPTGYVLTRVPRHYVVLGTGGLLTVAAMFTATADTPLALYVGAFSMGLASGAYFIAANPLVSELFPDRVGRAIGIHGTASQLAAVIAPLFVGAVLAFATWELVFILIAGAAGFATVGLTVSARNATLPDAGRADRDLLGAVRRQWPIIASGVAIIGVTAFVWNGVFNFYVTYMVETKGLAEPTGRTLLTVVFAAGVPAFWYTGRLADRVAHVPLMLAILGAFIVTLLGLTAATGLFQLALVSVVIGYVIHSLFPVMDTYMLDSLPDENRASAYAVYSATMMLVSATGSGVVGALRDREFAFDLIFGQFSLGLIIVLGILLGLYLTGRVPESAS